VLAVASMTWGNLVALRQRQAVRLLAWSSVAHAGYLLVPLGAVAADPDLVPQAVTATVGYLVLYVAMNLGAFACVTAAGVTAIDDFRGLGRRSPLLAGALAFFLIGLAGLPPTLAGLVAKVVVLRSALLGGAGWLAVVVAVNTVIGLAYYLRLAAMSFRGGGATVRPRVAPTLAVAVTGSLVVVLLLSVAPQLALGLTP
jgi:NADH-quinone oxidoreductase subunit N